MYYKGCGDRQMGKGIFFSVVAYGASHCNQWGRCDALFCNLFEDISLHLYRPTEYRMKEVVSN